MAEDGQQTARPAACPPQELPPPPRLVQYGVPPARQQPAGSRDGAGGVTLPFLAREDIRESERRQQLAHSIQLLQRKAARQQQEARQGIVPRPVGSALLEQVGSAPGAARLIAYRPPPAAAATAPGYAKPAPVPAAIHGPAASMARTPPNPDHPAAVTAGTTVTATSGTGSAGGQPITAAAPAVATAVTQPKPPAPTATTEIRNGTVGGDGDGRLEHVPAVEAGRSGAPVPLSDGRDGAVGGVTAKRASLPPQEEGEVAEPAAKRARSDAGVDTVADTTGSATTAAAADTAPAGTCAAAAAPAVPPAPAVIPTTVSDATVPSAAANAVPGVTAAVTTVVAAATDSTSTAAAPVTVSAASTPTASPTHRGKKSWLSRLANTEESAGSPASSDGEAEKSTNHSATPAPAGGKECPPTEGTEPSRPPPDSAASSAEVAETTDSTPPPSGADGSPADEVVKMETGAEGPPSSEGAEPNGREASTEAEEQDQEAQDGSSSGDGESSATGAEESNGVLAPRAAAAATKAAAAAKKSPGRPKKKPLASPAGDGPKRPSVMTLKKSGESFTQTNFCCQIATKLPRCRECRAVPTQRHTKPTSIYCRFTAFRKVRYTRTGQLTVTGFCDPYRDSGGESDRLWRANPDGPPTMAPETAKFLLAHVGNQFCDLVTEEAAARDFHMGEDKTVAWKRVVQGCREMCDVCETTLFNVHWVCSRCGFAVCVDCYRSRRDGTAKDWGEQLAERDQYRWLMCGVKPHQQDRLVLTQIVAGDALEMLNRQVHEARQMAGLPFSCECDVAKRLQEEAAAAGVTVKTEPGSETVGVKTEACADQKVGGARKPAGGALSFPADVSLSKIALDDSDSDDSDGSDAGGGSLALRRLLVPGTQAETKPKAVKKERPVRPKRSGWSMGDSLDEVLDKVARCSAAAPASHTASGPAALQHFVRRWASKRGFRERLPIRIMTLGESTRLYPAVRHSWLCDGKLLRLHESDAPDSERLFRDQWKRGQPVICSGIGGGLDHSLWSVDAFIRDFGDFRNDLINCRTGNIVPNQPMRRFWEGFESVTRRLRDDKGQPMILKLKDWPPGEDFADMMPRRFDDLMSVLPMTEYTRRDGRLNLAACLPEIFVRPDLGPKMYIAYGCALHPGKASTNLHLDVSDAVNIMVYVGIPPDGDADNAEALRAIDEAGCDQLTKRRVRDEMPGALWHIYHAADADKIRDLLNKVAIERGVQLEPHHDPIHDQSWYLDGQLRRRLYEEYRVEGYPIVQCAGDAVFIPAGAPHQVRNLHSCIKVAEDFVSPENIGHCFDLTQEFRSLSDTHTNHEDKLQIKNIIYHAMKDAVSCLLGAARPPPAARVEAATDGESAAGRDGTSAAPAAAAEVKTEPAL